MKGLLSIVQLSWKNVHRTYNSKFRWLLIAFIALLYRIDFMPADAGGLAQLFQVGSILFIVLFLLRVTNNTFIPDAISRTNTTMRWCLFIYLFGIISAAWSVSPGFSFFLAFQNVVLIYLCFYVLSLAKTFVEIERLFLIAGISVCFFEFFSSRLIILSFFYHHLSLASSSAMLFAYSSCEYLSIRIKDARRKRFLRNVAFATGIMVVLNTSSGANASAIIGMGVGLFFSGHIYFALLFAVVGLFFILNDDLLERFIFFIMPGKNKAVLENVTGRTELWEVMEEYSAQKPWFGWGYACIERIASLYGPKQSPDAHNNYLGFKGSLGYTGLAIAIVHFVTAVYTTFTNRIKPGFTGLLGAVTCALVNGYTYGFLSGKACSITVIYFGVIVMTYLCYKTKVYSRGDLAYGARIIGETGDVVDGIDSNEDESVEETILVGENNVNSK